MAFAPAGGEAALGAWTLVAALGFVVCFGLLQSWRNTVGAVFASLAKISIGVKYVGHIHPLSPLGSINNAVEHTLSDWAEKCQKQYGLAMHYMAELWGVMTQEIRELSAIGLAANHWQRYVAVPWLINEAVSPWRKKTTKAAATAAGAAAAVAVAKKAAQSRTHSQSSATAKAQTTATHADHTATQAKTAAKAATKTAAQTAVITVAHPSIADLPIPFGRTIAQIKKRLTRAEAWVGATALSVAMANVLGLPNPRCLRDGPLGRISRRLCGIPTSFLNDLLGLVADFFILENVCTLLPWIESAASEVGTPLVELLTDAAAGLCDGNQAPARLRGPKPSVPALIFGVSASGV